MPKPIDVWSELSPERRLMLETLAEHDGISEHSAGLSFKRGDIAWGLKRNLIEWRPYRDRQDLYATDAGRRLLDGAR
jgi:hypothetical protein